MGVSLNAVGGFNLNPNRGITGAGTEGRTRFDPFERRAADPTPQSNAAPEGEAGADAGPVYQVPDGVALQSQLQNTLGANNQAPSVSANAFAGTQAGSTTGGTSGAAQPAAANTAASTATSTAASATVQSEENQLYATLQALGLSPAALEEFMNTGDLLAEISPALFQAYLNAVTTIAQPDQATNSSGAAPNAGVASVSGAAPTAGAGQTAQGSNTTPAPSAQIEFAAVEVSPAQAAVTPAASGTGGSKSNTTPTSASQAESATVEVSEAEVQITPASSGHGSEVNVTAAAFVATIQPAQSAPQTPATSFAPESAANNDSATSPNRNGAGVTA